MTADNQHSTTLTATKAGHEAQSGTLHQHLESIITYITTSPTIPAFCFFGHMAAANPGVKRLGVSDLTGFVITSIHHYILFPQTTPSAPTIPSSVAISTPNIGHTAQDTRDTDLGFAFDVG